VGGQQGAVEDLVSAAGFWSGRRVLVTGHTGFKGGWLALWLQHLGARVTGYALPAPTDPSFFAVTKIQELIDHVQGDIRDAAAFEACLRKARPEVVLHLAAQSLVRRSFDEPRLTFDVNLMGTLNVLEAARRTESVRAVVAVTSDKCYRNVEWEWGYRETDELGGYDPYSASKACAEIAIRAYQDPRFQQSAQAPRELKEINPRYSYLDHFGRLPFRDPADAEKLTGGLRNADLAK